MTALAESTARLIIRQHACSELRSGCSELRITAGWGGVALDMRNVRALAWGVGVMVLLTAMAMTRHHFQMMSGSMGGEYLTWRHAFVQEAPHWIFWALALPVIYLFVERIAQRGWSWSPTSFALCGEGKVPVCPSGGAHPRSGDVFLVEFLGLVAASITGASSIRKLSGTSTPYGVPIVSLALKLPIGALTALAGLVFLRAGYGPTITSLNQVQICAYALVFGASQQLFMQFVDKQAKTVLDAATTPGGKSRTS